MPLWRSKRNNSIAADQNQPCPGNKFSAGSSSCQKVALDGSNHAE
jgi:hypothetical protein